jgi:hypothetical protein
MYYANALEVNTSVDKEGKIHFPFSKNNLGVAHEKQYVMRHKKNHENGSEFPKQACQDYEGRFGAELHLHKAALFRNSPITSILDKGNNSDARQAIKEMIPVLKTKNKGGRVAANIRRNLEKIRLRIKYNYKI